MSLQESNKPAQPEPGDALMACETYSQRPLPKSPPDMRIVRKILSEEGSVITDFSDVSRDELVASLEALPGFNKAARQTGELPKETLIKLYNHMIDLVMDNDP